MESLLEHEVATPETIEETQVPPAMSAELFAELYEQYSHKVLTFILSKNIPYHDALEISQETFIKVYVHFDQLRDFKKVHSWIMEIAFQTLHSFCRRKKRSMVAFSVLNKEDNAGLIAIRDRGTKTPFESVATSEQEGILRSVMSRLSQKDQTILEVCDIQHQKMREAAETLHIPVGTVKSSLSLARKHLQELLQKRISYEDVLDN